jgi:hypothetical protein
MVGIALRGAVKDCGDPWRKPRRHTITEALRAEEPYFPIPDGVFEPGPLAKGLDRGIKLAKVKQ